MARKVHITPTKNHMFGREVFVLNADITEAERHDPEFFDAIVEDYPDLVLGAPGITTLDQAVQADLLEVRRLTPISTFNTRKSVSDEHPITGLYNPLTGRLLFTYSGKVSEQEMNSRKFFDEVMETCTDMTLRDMASRYRMLTLQSAVTHGLMVIGEGTEPEELPVYRFQDTEGVMLRSLTGHYFDLSRGEWRDAYTEVVEKPEIEVDPEELSMADLCSRMSPDQTEFIRQTMINMLSMGIK